MNHETTPQYVPILARLFKIRSSKRTLELTLELIQEFYLQDLGKYGFILNRK